MITKPSSLSHINFPFKAYRNMVWRIAVLFSFFVAVVSNGTSWAVAATQENLNPESAIQNSKLSTGVFSQKTKNLCIPFIANNGQVSDKVRFYANTFGGTVFVTKDGEIVYALPDVETQGLASSMHSPKGIRDARCMIHDTRNTSNITDRLPCILHHESNIPYCTNCLLAYLAKHTGRDTQGVAIKETLVGSRVQKITGNEKAATKVCYFKGKDPSKWKTNISTYDVVSLGEVYDGIELELKAYGNNVEKLFCVKPDANPEQIQVKLSGAKGLQINGEGQLEAETELGTVKFTKPVAYQEIKGKRVEIECGYVIADCGMQGEAGSKKVEARSWKYALLNSKWNTKRSGTTDFTDCTDKVGWVKRSAPNKKGDGKDGFASLNSSYTHYTNPGQIGKRLIGSREKGMGRRGAYPATNFCSKSNHPQSETCPRLRSGIRNPQLLEYGFKVASYDKTKDLIIDPLLASTFLGGSSYENPNSLALDSSGNVYMTGYTGSSNYPISSGAYDTSYNNNSDIFVSKFNSDLTSLLSSTFLGGSDSDESSSITVDSSGSVYVTGKTNSSNFPVTSGAYDISYSSSRDVFVSKFSNDLASLSASTLLGGSGNDYASSITVDSSGNVYVAGHTNSSDFPTAGSAYDSSYDSFRDVFVSKFNSNLSSLLASTFLGGSDEDFAYSIVSDSTGNVYVAGVTSSSNFPSASGAYDTSMNGSSDVFVSKFSSNLTSLSVSTFLGGSDGENVQSIALDSGGNVYVTGYTQSSNFPTTSGAYDTTHYSNGSSDIFISKFNSNLNSLSASTFLGGSNYDYAYSIDLDSSGNVYITGSTESSNFPTSGSAYDTSYNGVIDAFVSKFSNDLTSLSVSTYIGGSGSEYAYSIALDSSGNVYVVGSTPSSNFPITSGAYDASLEGSSDAFVSKFDSNLSATTTTTTTTTTSTTSTTIPTTTTITTTSTTVPTTTTSTTVTIPTTTSTTSTTAPTTTTTSTTSTTVPSTTTSTTATTTTTSTTTTTTAPTTTTSSTSTTSTTTSTTSTTTTTIPVCTDSYESNDSFSAAYGPITSGSSYSGKICSASDVDYFKITVARAGIISFTLSVPSGRDYDLYLYNSSQSEVAYSSQGAGATDSIIYFASTTGTYYIKVFGYGGDYDENQTYTLSGTWLSTATAPTVTTGSASNITTNSVTLNGTVNDNGVSTTAWFQYGTTSGSYGSTSPTQSVSGPNTTVSISISGLSSGTTYYYRIAAQNSAGTTYGNEISFTTSDASRPTGSVNINSGASYTNSTTVTLNLSATDNSGVTGYYSSTSSSTPSVSTSGWTSISSTTSYTADVSYTVSSGDGNKAVYVWYKDNSGNVSNTASDEITLDTATPTIIITTPTSSSTYTTTNSTMSMDGTSLDNASGISSVTWSNSKGGNGTATGTTAWSVSSITLSSGDNTVTVTAKDNAGNTGTDAIAVTYSGGTVASPTPTPKPSATPTPKPSPSPKTSPSPKASPSPTPKVTPVATPRTSPTPVHGSSVVLGFVYDPDSEPLTGVSVAIAGNDFSESTETDSNGYYEFDELAAGDYTLTYEKDGYETQTMSISLGEGKVFVVDDVTMEESETGKIYGYVVKINGNPIESARLKLKGIKTKVVKNTSSDADGFFEFTGLGADTYVIFAKKTRYKKAKATVKLEEGESEEIEIEMKRTTKRIIERQTTEALRR